MINQSSFIKDKLGKSGKKPDDSKYQKKISLNQSIKIDKDKTSKLINKASLNSGRSPKEDRQV